MRNYYGVNYLELVELYAKNGGYISSEYELSVLFSSEEFISYELINQNWVQ